MVDIGSLTKKLKGLTLDKIKETLSKPVGDGRKSSYKLLSIAGETIALSDTGLSPDEKFLHNKDDFARLYVPASLKENQSALEEILLRMFPLTSSQSKKEVLPPEDEKEFELVRESLHYRLETLRSEILDDSSDSVSIREKLGRFDRLTTLIDSLEKNFSKKRRQQYFALQTSSSAPSTTEPKLDLSKEDIEDILRQFGLVLLQSKYQLPGFTFQTSPNQIVREVQSIALDDEEDFLNQAAKEGEIDESIQDILDPKSKEARILASLQEKIETMVGDLGERLSDETIDKLSFDFDGKDVEKYLSSLIESLFTVVEQYEETSTKASELIENMQSQIEELQDKVDECNEKLKGVKSESSTPSTSSDKESKEADIDDRVDALEEEKKGYLAQINKLKQDLLDKQTLTLQRDDATRKLGLVASEVESLKAELVEKQKTIQSLQIKEAAMAELQERIKTFEEQEELSKAEKRELEKKTAELERLSQEKQALEEKLAEFEENLGELQTLVSSIETPKGNGEVTAFQELRNKIMSILPVKVVDDSLQRAVNLPILTLPSILEIKADLKSFFCDFLVALTNLFSKYFDSEGGQALQTELTAILDTLFKSSVETLIAMNIQKILLNVQDKGDKGESESYAEQLAGVQELKNLEASADALFFQYHEDARGDVEKMNKRLSEEDLPSYPVLFFLYLVALRDWVNCVEINSKPLECPQIPERLLRKEIQCR